MGGSFFLRIDLLVTGETEEAHLPKLFSRLEATGVCQLTVRRRIRQYSPRSSHRPLQVVGRPKGRLPTRMEEEISLPSRASLADPDRLLVLIDDLEHDRRGSIESIFELYRGALDLLLDDAQRSRASVHFLANMLEAYFFADPRAVEEALDSELASPESDVEQIRNPKGLLKQKIPGYGEKHHGGMILDRIDLHRVLAEPQACGWLRSCVAWLVRGIRAELDPSLSPSFETTRIACHLENGRCEPLTLEQGRIDPRN